VFIIDFNELYEQLIINQKHKINKINKINGTYFVPIGLHGFAVTSPRSLKLHKTILSLDFLVKVINSQANSSTMG
jgi:hypothetical protein